MRSVKSAFGKILSSISAKKTFADTTVVVTSCARHDLLDKSLGSFQEYNTYKGIKEIIVVEDSPLSPRKICDRYGARLIHPDRKLGQIGAVDRGYEEVDTKYIFHMEDDWEFYRGGFIEKSKALLEVDPSTVCVWLRHWDDTNGHPLSFKAANSSFAQVEAGWLDDWFGFTLNPGLRRLSDYKLLGSYSSILQGDRHFEIQISRRYGALGFRGVLLDKQGFVRHLGDGRHVGD